MKVIEIVFSPTGGTEKAAQLLAKHWSETPETVDLCDVHFDGASCAVSAQDLVLIAMPSYGGRAPAVAIERLKQIRGRGAKCVLLCVYGNRAYEDSLVEMADAAKACGFQVIAAVAAVAEHSIMPQYAANRPDAADEAQLAAFAEKIAEKTAGSPSIPGSRPYKKSGGVGLVPKPNKSCIQCGLCAERRPVGAIDPVSFSADGKKCISCMRCVKLCPQGAGRSTAPWSPWPPWPSRRPALSEKRTNCSCKSERV